MNEKPPELNSIIEVSVKEIGENFRSLRLIHPCSHAFMVRSIGKYGQLSPVVVGPQEKGFYEMVDGFKRLYACRELGQACLKARVLSMGPRGLKAAVIHLNWAHKSIGDLEEALVLQSLYREDDLSQQEIGVLLGRHKSWVSRRISLIERLCEEAVAHLRLGLVGTSIGRELARLPRGNQEAALAVILKYRFTYREAQRLVRLLLSRPRWDREAILRFPGEILEDRSPPRPKKSEPSRTIAAIMERLRIMKKQAHDATEKLSPAISARLTDKHRRDIFSVIEEVEQALGELKKRAADKDHGAALC